MNDDRLPEDRNWIASTGMTRRSALAGTAFAAGFAAACQPVASSTIKTDGDGIREMSVTIPTKNAPTDVDTPFQMPAFVARPSGVDKPPVLIVVHEIFGVHEWVKDMCRRFAKAGYMAIAPDLFARHGDATKEADFQKLIANIVSKAPDEQVMADIDTAILWAGQNGGDTARHYITGFCWGGRVVWLYAAHDPQLKAGVAFYGRVKGDPKPLQPSNPIDQIETMRAPVLGQYGGKDKGIPLTDLDEMRAKLAAAKNPSKITVYPDADHGFMADYRPSYNEAAAKQAWEATLAWFKANR